MSLWACAFPCLPLHSTERIQIDRSLNRVRHYSKKTFKKELNKYSSTLDPNELYAFHTERRYVYVCMRLERLVGCCGDCVDQPRVTMPQVLREQKGKTNSTHILYGVRPGAGAIDPSILFLMFSVTFRQHWTLTRDIAQSVPLGRAYIHSLP